MVSVLHFYLWKATMQTTLQSVDYNLRIFFSQKIFPTLRRPLSSALSNRTSQDLPDRTWGIRSSMSSLYICCFLSRFSVAFEAALFALRLNWNEKILNFEVSYIYEPFAWCCSCLTKTTLDFVFFSQFGQYQRVEPTLHPLLLHVRHWPNLYHHYIYYCWFFSVILKSINPRLVFSMCPLWIRGATFLLHTFAPVLSNVCRTYENVGFCSLLFFIHGGHFDISKR